MLAGPTSGFPAIRQATSEPYTTIDKSSKGSALCCRLFVYGNVRQNMGIPILVKYYFTSGSNSSPTSAYLITSSNSTITPSIMKHHIWLTHGVKDTILYHIVKGSLAGIQLEREVFFPYGFDKTRLLEFTDSQIIIASLITRCSLA
jgi:hypothetical protein